MILVKIIKYQLHDVMRSKWIIFYTAFYFIVIYGMLTFTNDISKVLLSLMNVVLIIIPLISTILGTIYFYNNRDYIVFMLSQPINRTTIFLGLYFGLAIPLILSFVVGVVLGIVVYSSSLQNYFGILLLIMLSGIFLTVILGIRTPIVLVVYWFHYGSSFGGCQVSGSFFARQIRRPGLRRLIRSALSPSTSSSPL